MARLRTTSLKVGRALYEIIKDIAPCFPLVAEATTPYPFVIYRRQGLTNLTNKDRRIEFIEHATVEVQAVTKTYDESIDLAQALKVRLEGHRGEISDLNITDITLTNASEDYVGDAYVQKLYFDIEIEKH